MKITRRQLRQIIKEEISRLSEREVSQKEIDDILNTNWDNVLPKGIVKYDQGKKKGGAVGDIQKALHGLVLLGNTISPGTIDSRYGNNTLKSIRHFQTKTQGLKPDGDYGPNTRKAMIAAFKKAKEEEQKEEPSKKAGSVDSDGKVTVNTGKFSQPSRAKSTPETACPPQFEKNTHFWGVDMSKANPSPNAYGQYFKVVYNVMGKDMKSALDRLAKRKHCWQKKPGTPRNIPSGKWVTYFASKDDWKKGRVQGNKRLDKTTIYNNRQEEKIKRLWGSVAVYPFKIDDINYQLVVQIKSYKDDK